MINKVRNVRRLLNIALVLGLFLFSTGTAFAQAVAGSERGRYGLGIDSCLFLSFSCRPGSVS